MSKVEGYMNKYEKLGEFLIKSVLWMRGIKHVLSHPMTPRFFFLSSNDHIQLPIWPLHFGLYKISVIYTKCRVSSQDSRHFHSWGQSPPPHTLDKKLASWSKPFVLISAKDSRGYLKNQRFVYIGCPYFLLNGFYPFVMLRLR